MAIFLSKPEFKQNSENLFDWNKCCHELKLAMKCNVFDICPSLRSIQLSPESEEFNENCDGVCIAQFLRLINIIFNYLLIKCLRDAVHICQEFRFKRLNFMLYFLTLLINDFCCGCHFNSL